MFILVGCSLCVCAWRSPWLLGNLLWVLRGQRKCKQGHYRLSNSSPRHAEGKVSASDMNIPFELVLTKNTIYRSVTGMQKKVLHIQRIIQKLPVIYETLHIVQHILHNTPFS